MLILFLDSIYSFKSFFYMISTFFNLIRLNYNNFWGYTSQGLVIVIPFLWALKRVQRLYLITNIYNFSCAARIIRSHILILRVSEYEKYGKREFFEYNYVILEDLNPKAADSKTC